MKLEKRLKGTAVLSFLCLITLLVIEIMPRTVKITQAINPQEIMRYYYRMSDINLFWENETRGLFVVFMLTVGLTLINAIMFTNCEFWGSRWACIAITLAIPIIVSQHYGLGFISKTLIGAIDILSVIIILSNAIALSLLLERSYKEGRE